MQSSARSNANWQYSYLLLGHYYSPNRLWIFPFFAITTKNTGGCEQSAEDAYSSMAPDLLDFIFEYGSFSPPFTFPFYIYISWDIDLLNFMFGLYYESQNINLLLFHLHDVSCIDHVFLFFHLLKKIFTKIIVESL